jgi:outer membrane protein TolC
MKRIKLYTIICAAFVSATQVAAQTVLPLSLAECRAKALAASEDVQEAGNKLKQSDLDKQIAFTNYLPKIDGSVMGEYMFPDMDMMGVELRMRGALFAGLTLTQPLYTGGKIMSGNRLAKIGREVSREQQRATRMDVLVNADNAYWTYLAVLSKVNVLESYMAQMDTLKAQTGTAVEAGMATGNDLLRVDTKNTEISYQLQKARNGAELCRLSLCRIIGADYDTQLQLTDTPQVEAMPENLTTSLAERPELRMLDLQIAAEQQNLKMTRANMLPTIGLSVGYTYYGNIKTYTEVDMGNGTKMPYTSEFKDGIGLALLSVQIPIFYWGENFKKLSKSRLAIANSQLQRQKNERLMDIEVRRAVINIGDGYRMVQTAETGLSQAEENLRVMTDRYNASMCTLTDLLDAQSQWQQAESNLIEARTQYKIYETEYQRAIGTLSDK